MDQHDAQTGTDPLQGVRDIGGAVIDDQLDRDAPFEERLLEDALDVECRLATTESPVGNEPGSVVEQRHQIALAQATADRHARAVHHVAVPDLAGASGDETAFLLRQACRAGDPRQAVLLEQAVDARTRQGPPCDGAGGLEQALDLADRAAGVLALGGENRRLDGGREFRLAAIGPHRGDQSVEAASAVAVIPPLDRLLA